MFGLFKANPEKKLCQQYDTALEKAMHAQRNGDMRLFAELSAEASKLLTDIQALQQQKK